jgi:predicted transcriptional regulator
VEVDMTNPDSEVQDVMTRRTVSVGEKLTLRSLAAVLAELDIGVALVEASDGSVAVVSERDVVRAIADGADPDEVWAVDVMGPRVVATGQDSSIVDVARVMSDEAVRHVAVTADGAVVGVVSVRDVLPVLTAFATDA